MPKRCDIPPERWDEVADLFEVGFKHACVIAKELGVSLQTVMREMRRRGAQKGTRVHETVAELNNLIDLKQRHAAMKRAAMDRMAAERSAATLVMLGDMVAAIAEADERGNLAFAAEKIDQTAAACGFSLPRRSRRR